MLFASGLLEPRLAKESLTGQKNILAKDVMVVLASYTATAINGETYDSLAINDPTRWKGFHFREVGHAT